MSRDAQTFLYSAVAGFLGAVSFLLNTEIRYAQDQQRRRIEAARAAHFASQQRNG